MNVSLFSFWLCLSQIYIHFIHLMYTFELGHKYANQLKMRRWYEKKKKKTNSLEVFSIHVMSLCNIQSFQAMNQIHCNTVYCRTHTHTHTHIWYHTVCAKGSSVLFGCARMTRTNDLSRLVNVAAKELFMFRAENTAGSPVCVSMNLRLIEFILNVCTQSPESCKKILFACRTCHFAHFTVHS